LQGQGGLRYADQRWVRNWPFSASSNDCLNLKNEKSEWTEASHCLQGQGGPSFTPKRSTYEQNFTYPLGPPRRYAQGRQRLCAQEVHEASNCKAKIMLTTVISEIPQQRVPNSIQSGNLLQAGSSLVGQLLYAFSSKFCSRSCGASTGRSRPEVVVVVELMTTGNSPPSKSGAFLKCQAAKIEVIPLCLQVPSNYLHDYAFTDACKQGSKKGFAVQDTSKDFFKQLTNIQLQGSVISGSATRLHALMEEVGHEDVACLPPPEATNVEYSQASPVRFHHIFSRVDAPSWHDTINIVSTFRFFGNNGLCWLLNSGCITFAVCRPSMERQGSKNAPTKPPDEVN